MSQKQVKGRKREKQGLAAPMSPPGRGPSQAGRGFRIAEGDFQAIKAEGH